MEAPQVQGSAAQFIGSPRVGSSSRASSSAGGSICVGSDATNIPGRSPEYDDSAFADGDGMHGFFTADM
eukprot:2997710-Karenia_brevis.AAC.1